MKKLKNRFKRQFYGCYLRKPTESEIWSFELGVKAGIEKLHNELHKSIEKITPLKKIK